MSVDRILALKLVTDVGNIDKKLSGVQGRISGIGHAFGSFAKAGALGVVLGAVDAVSSALSQGITDFRAGERASNNLARTWKKLGLNGDELQTTIDSISTQAIDLGFDDTESVNAFDRLLKKTGDVEKSQKLLAAAWDLARAKQIPLSTAVGEVTKLYDGSSKALKQYGLEGVKGMAAVDAALATSSGAAEAFATTSEGRWVVLQGKIGEVFESIAGAGLGLVDKALGPLGDIGDKLGALWEENQPKLQALADMIGPKIGAVLERFGALVTALGPYFAGAWAIVQPIVNSMGTVIGGVLDTITGVIDTIVALLNGDFSGAWTAAQGVVQSVIDTITTIVGAIAGTLANIVGAVGDAAGDVASGIWDGIVGGLEGLGGAILDAVFGGIRGAAQAALNVLAGLVNTFIDGLNMVNDFSWPALGFDIDLGPLADLAGQPRHHHLGIDAGSFRLWPEMDHFTVPKLAAGGIATGPTLAMIGEGRYNEAVIPLDGRTGMGNYYTVNVYVAPGGNLVEAGRQTVAAIRAYEAREGRQWRRGANG